MSYPTDDEFAATRSGGGRRFESLTFDDLRRANVKRLPTFRNGKGDICHPTIRQCRACDALSARRQNAETPCLNCGAEEKTLKMLPPGFDWGLAQWSNATLGELGEAANLIKKIERGDFTLDEKRDELADALCDVVTYLDLLAHRADIDLGEATRSKWNRVSERVKSPVRL